MNTIDISWKSLWRILFMFALAVVLYLTLDILVILFLAIVISSAIDAPITYLEKKKIPRILGTLIIFLAVLLVLAILLYIVIPVALVELDNFFSSLYKLKIPEFFGTNISKSVKSFLVKTQNLSGLLLSGSASFFDIITEVLGNVIIVVTTLVLSLYLAINRDGVEKFLRAILPRNYEDYVIDVYLRVRKKMGLWLQGQLILSLIIAILVFIGSWVLGIKYGLILGILAGFFELVPYIGPIITGAVVILVAIKESFMLGVYALALFIIIQQIENHILTPLVMKKTVGISPVVVVIALLAGTQLAGFVGLILAVPVAVVLQELVEDFSERKLKARDAK